VTEPGVFDAYAGTYDATVAAAIGASGESVEYFARLKAQLTRGALEGESPRAVLDFGCGTGNGTAALADVFAEARVVGVDPSAESVAAAERRHRGARGCPSFVRSAGRVLPFADESFDLVFTSCVFHHIARRDHAHWAREIRRVLRPRGSLFLFEHNPYNPLTRRVVRACPFDAGVVLLSARYAARMVAAAGFVAERPRYYFFFPNALRGLRPLEAALRGVPLGAQYYLVGRKPG
jgi:ubiquinone/menaquinone biosynthesis C-methylase UbiE